MDNDTDVILDNCKYLSNDVRGYSLLELPIASISFLNNGMCRSEIKAIVAGKGTASNKLRQIYESIKYFWRAEKFYKWMLEIQNTGSDNPIFYSYWCNYYTLAMVLHRDELPGWKMYSRLHGFDLYEERYKGGRQPFRWLINEKIDKLFFVSKNSMDYYTKVHDKCCVEKMVLNRLGTAVNSDNWREPDITTVVSCSSIIPLKRVDYIIQALSLIEQPIHWIHFGDGYLMENVQTMAQEYLDHKSNVTYSFKGKVENSLINEYYSTGDVDIFINVSSTEGAPMSIMEAMAAGIPIIATNVGEASIMVQNNGYLISDKPSYTDIADAINNYILLSGNEKRMMHKASRELWEQMYNVESNVQELLLQIGD